MTSICTTRLASAIVTASLVLGAGMATALAADKEAEKAAVKACEKSICAIAVSKKPDAGDVKCSLGRTWTKADLAETAAKKKLSWSLGDAHCDVALDIPAQGLVDGLTKPAHTLELPSHTAKCEVAGEKDGEPAHAVTVKLAPKFEFKDGKANKVWVNVTEVDGGKVVKGAVWSAATVTDTFGLFHDQNVAALNKLLLESCPKNHPL